VAEFMSYQGQLVEIFGWAPDGKAVPNLPASCAGESKGDYAFVEGTAMEWDGDRWIPSPWKDFAVWKVAATS
jgi:hypothetical protein